MVIIVSTRLFVIVMMYFDLYPLYLYILFQVLDLYNYIDVLI